METKPRVRRPPPKYSEIKIRKKKRSKLVMSLKKAAEWLLPFIINRGIEFLTSKFGKK